MIKLNTGFGDGYYDIDMIIRLNDLVLTIHFITFEEGSPVRNTVNYTSRFYNLHYIPYGKGVFRAGSRNISAVPGTFFLFTPGVTYSKISDASDPMHEYRIHFSFEVNENSSAEERHPFPQNEISNIAGALSQRSFMFSEDRYTKDTIDVFKKLKFELEVTQAGQYIILSSLFSEVLVKALRCFGNYSKMLYDAPYILTKDKRRYVIDETFEWECNTLTLDLLAQKLKVSRRQAEREITGFYSMSFKEKLTEVRMKKAEGLLEYTSMTVEEISMSIGYKKVNHFYKVFKKYKGMTPGEYRLMHENANRGGDKLPIPWLSR